MNSEVKEFIMSRNHEKKGRIRQNKNSGEADEFRRIRKNLEEVRQI